MYRNHLLFAIRLFLKEGGYSILNVLGLALGITVGIILLSYLHGELTYDQHYEKHDQVFRYTNYMKADGADFNTARSARELAEVLKADLPEVIQYVRLIGYDRWLIEVPRSDGSKGQFYEDRIWSADSTMFQLFDHKFYEGEPTSCLEGPGKVVLTKSIAEKFFGDEPALGKVLDFPDGDKREVTAVISDLPYNTHLQYDILLSGVSERRWVNSGDATRKSEGYWNPGAYTYLLLPADYDPQVFYDKFPAIFDKTYGLFAQRINGSVEPNLQKIADIHFNSQRNGDQPTGNKAYMYTFAAVGFFIILLACINYMNMATARSVTRTGEIGVRKVLGFSRAALFRQVMTEAILLATVAMLFAVAASYVILEWTPFNDMIGKELSLDLMANPYLLPGTISITLFIGLLSGLYPALYIPAVPVVQALKGTFTGDRSGAILRKGLIVFQFVISLFVIICTVIMDNQITYMQQKDIGFEKDNVLLIDVRDTASSNHMDAIKELLLANPKIEEAAASYGTPGVGTGGNVMWVERDTGMVQQSMDIIWAGEDYLKTLGIEIVEGRGLRWGTDGDLRKSLLVNQTGVKELGWEGNPLGRRVRYFHAEDHMRVVGVMKDFNFQSLHDPIYPLFIIPDNDGGGTLHLRVSGEDLPATLAFIEEVWTQFDRKHPFDYTFLDKEFARQYEEDQTQQRLIGGLSYVCIFVSILGLIGLSAFTASRRAKEISIRKVLGAQISTIIILFSKDYLRLIVIAFVISIPLANYVIIEWLSGFAYRVDILWGDFVIPGLLVLVLGMVTVSLQLVRSARANPVDGLRSE